MFRSLFILLSKASWAQKLIMSLGFARFMATRFVAGDYIDDAVEAIKSLNARGILATLDHLGENTTNAGEAENSAKAIKGMLDAIVNSGIKSNVSIKLSQIGYNLGGDICINILRDILTYAKKNNIFIRIDMEDSSTVDNTLAYYTTMRKEGLDNVGLVMQSYLYRSEKDIRKLMDLYTPIRLCKGAYKEPASVAFPSKADVDKNYDLIASILLDTSLDETAPKQSENGYFPPLPALATHDEKRIDFVKQYSAKKHIPSSNFEFQMLYGIRRDLQETLVKEGFGVRIYVPFGTQWYPYFMRRLAERPANLWFMLSNLLR